jgi:hypothetical protein
MRRHPLHRLLLEVLEEKNAPGNLSSWLNSDLSTMLNTTSTLSFEGETPPLEMSRISASNWEQLPAERPRSTAPVQEPFSQQKSWLPAITTQPASAGTSSEVPGIVQLTNLVNVSSLTMPSVTSTHSLLQSTGNAVTRQDSDQTLLSRFIQQDTGRPTQSSATQELPTTISSTGDTDDIKSSLQALPLTFETNVGQVDDSVAFLTRGQGYSFFVSATSATLDVQADLGGWVLQMDLVGGNAQAPAIGLDRHEGNTNYLSGSDSSRWLTDIANYTKVAFDDVYKGIDIVYYGDSQQQIEYDFVVAPGADPSQILLNFDGAEAMNLDEQGHLVFETGERDLVQKAPVIYQEIDGKRVPVEGRYQLLDDNQVRFELGDYDSSLPLIIDPIVTAYNSYLGGTSTDQGYDIAVDADGNAYVIGMTSSQDLPTTTGAYMTASNYPEHFVAKLNASGSGFSYVTHLGANYYTDPFEPTMPPVLPFEAKPAIAIDSSGNAIVTGASTNPNFPYLTYYGSNLGNPSAFAVKLNSTGSSLLYSVSLGGTSSEGGSDVALDADGNAYLTGLTKSSDFMAGYVMNSWPGFNSSFNGYAVKLTSSGGVVYARYLTGNTYDRMNGIAVNSSGEAVIVGQTVSTDCAVNALFPTPDAGQNGIVTKLSSTGSVLFATYLGGSGDDYAHAVAYDASGNIYVVGQTTSSNFPLQSAFQSTNYGTDAFLTKFNAAGTSLLYSTYLGGNGTDIAHGIAVNSNNEPYLVGVTDSAFTGYSNGFPVQNTQYTQLNGYPYFNYTDAFVTRFNSSASALITSTYFGTGLTEVGRGIALRGSDVHITGSTNGTGFATSGAAQTTNAGNTDAFIAKLSNF